MLGVTLAFLALAFTAEPIVLPKDVCKVQTRAFAMPLALVPEKRSQSLPSLKQGICGGLSASAAKGRGLPALIGDRHRVIKL
jgi:hypothetical protein